MWTDNETDIDLIGFSAHADLIRNVVVDPTFYQSSWVFSVTGGAASPA